MDFRQFLSQEHFGITQILQILNDDKFTRHEMPQDTEEQQSFRESIRELCIEHGLPWRESGRSISIPSSKTKYICPGEYKTQSGDYVTPFEIAGAICKVLNKNRVNHAMHNSRHFGAINSGGVWHYYYTKPGHLDDAVYIDIKSAYLSIYRQLPSWDCRYFPCRTIGFGQTRFPQTLINDLSIDSRDTKMARNAIVGISGATRAPLYLPTGHVIYTPTFGVTNYQFSLLVLTILQSAMYRAHAAAPSCVYANTDGMIVSAKHAANVTEEWSKWGLKASIKGSGDAEIRGHGAYKIGRLQSAVFEAMAEAKKVEYMATVKDIEAVSTFLEANYLPTLHTN